ncbi:MAG: signal peptidase II [Coprococcus sp.]|nr:signal peptidase II [Coprococcus sp.]
MDKKQKRRQSAAALAGVLFLIFLDQYTKILAIRYLKEHESFVILKDIFELHYLENRGMAFGLMQNQRTFFVLTTTVVFFVLVYFYLKTPVTKKYLPIRICTVFLTAGAAGNFIDRLLKGYVVDFFYFSFIDFPIFNVADIFVTVTFFVLLLLIFFYYKEDDFLVYLKKGQKDL